MCRWSPTTAASSAAALGLLTACSPTSWEAPTGTSKFRSRSVFCQKAKHIFTRHAFLKKKGVSVPRSFGAMLRIVKGFAENGASNRIKTVKSDDRYPWPAGKASGSR